MSDFTIGPVQGRRPYSETPTTARVPGMRRQVEDDPGWRNRAACRNEDPELFFPVGQTAPALAWAEDAKAVCARCPVIDACQRLLEHLEAELPGEVPGVYAGTTEAERHSAKRAERRRRERERAAAKRAVS